MSEPAFSGALEHLSDWPYIERAYNLGDAFYWAILLDTWLCEVRAASFVERTRLFRRDPLECLPIWVGVMP